LKASKKIISRFAMVAFLACLAIQAWRGVVNNTWNIAKSFIQLNDLEKSRSSITIQNNQMLTKVQALKKDPESSQIKMANEELNLVKDKDREIIIQLPD
jgi:hypothetical protein